MKKLRGMLGLFIVMLCSMMLSMISLAAQAKATIPVSVSLEGRPLSTPESFTVVLQADDASYPMPADAAGGTAQLVITPQKSDSGTIGTGSFDITYDRVGIYTYTVKQNPGSNADGTYDSTIYALTVYVVNDEENGGIKIEIATFYASEEAEKQYEASFVNKYAGTEITVVKNWSGDADVQASVRPSSIMVQLRSDGTAYGDPVTLTSETQWAYTWEDLPKQVYVDGEATDVSYDVIEVYGDEEVSEDGYIPGYTSAVTGSAADGYVITNTLETTDVTLEAKKVLIGRTLAAREFSFTVKNEAGVTVATGSNDANGNITFTPALTYTIADKGENKYTITENEGSLGGVTYDMTTKNVVVTVKDNGKGTISTEVKYDDSTDVPVFTNTYAATGTADLKGTKSIDGRDLNDGEFSFVVKEGNDTVATGSNNTKGEINFSTINYTLDDVGEHNYVVSETEGQLGGVTYDEHTFNVTVKVSDNGDGNLNVETVYPASGVAFVNGYEAEGSITLKGSKTLNERLLNAGEFKFTVNEVEEGKEPVLAATGSNAAGGDNTSVISFTEIKYTLEDVGTHTYEITEDDNKLGGVTYSTQKFTVTVEVKDNGDGTLSATATYPEGGAAFVNTYAATGSFTPEGTKTLTGRTLTAGEFKFTVNEVEEGQDLVKVASGSNKDGDVRTSAITFDTINYTLDDVGTHTYEITEDAGTLGGVEYSTQKFTVTVVVSDNGDGKLNVTSTYDAAAAFTNSYNATGKATFTGTKTLTGATTQNTRAMVAGEFTFTVKDENGIKVASGKNDAEGNITFTDITYGLSDIGTHTYTVTEDNNGKGGVTYSTVSYEVVVTVTDGREGTLNTVVTYPDNAQGVAFANTYAATGDIVLTAGKTLTCRTMDAGEFTFIATENGEQVSVGTNNERGVVTFDAISYDLDDLGEHTYVITESEGSKGGVTYDTDSSFEVKVNVTDNGDGTLTATATYPEAGAAFTNTYAATGSIVLEAAKTLEGRSLNDGEFNFIVTENGQTVATGKNDAEGKIRFSEIAYDLDDLGSHTYVLTEVSETLGGVTYSSQAFTVTVTVTDNRDGSLTATPVYPEGGAAFTNTYAADGSVNLQASKSLTGRSLKAGEFSFIVSENGKQIQKAANDANGVVSFEAISYSLADKGTHTYTISEEAGSVAGVTYDAATFDVTVVVTDNGDGTLGVAVTYPQGGAAFTNSYAATGTASLTASKNLIGRDQTEGEFSFTVTENGQTVATGKNAADGTVTFSGISYDLSDVGTHTYIISEDEGTVAGVTYDKSTYEVTVVVTDNGDATLNTAITYPEGGITFNNPYTATGSVTFDPADKTLTGRDMEDGEFTFIVTEDGQTVATGKNDEEGSITFSEITYDLDDVGTHTYTVSEQDTHTAGITYDDKTYEITVVVTDNGDGTLATEITYPKKGITFNNVYAADPAEATITATKTLENGTLTEGQFTFVLKNSKGKTVEKVTNAADGKITFSKLKFTEAGEYTYTIEETNDGQKGITYDANTYTVVIKVTDDGEGSLEARIASGSKITFTNKYEPEKETNPPTTTTKTNVPKTGDGTPIALYVTLLLAAAVVLVSGTIKKFLRN